MTTLTSDLIRFFVEKRSKIEADFTTDYGHVHVSISPGKGKISILINTYRNGKHSKQVWGSVSEEYRLGEDSVSEDEFYRAIDELKAL